MIPADLRATLETLWHEDPSAIQKYRTDPQYRADVNEHVQLARQMATDARDVARHRLLQRSGNRARYATDEDFRNRIEGRAILDAIAAVEATEWP